MTKKKLKGKKVMENRRGSIATHNIRRVRVTEQELKKLKYYIQHNMKK